MIVAGGKTMRIGMGYDVHRLVEDRDLIIGGVRIPYEKGLLGHSDADVLIHAVIDALLGATALGDIGSHFPDTDPRWKDADSAMLLNGVMDEIVHAGFSVGNVDVTLICERPKLRPYVDAIRSRLAELLRVPIDAVSVKGKTNEGMDATGEGLGVAVHAVALVVPAERD